MVSVTLLTLIATSSRQSAEHVLASCANSYAASYEKVQGKEGKEGKVQGKEGKVQGKEGKVQGKVRSRGRM